MKKRRIWITSFSIKPIQFFLPLAIISAFFLGIIFFESVSKPASGVPIPTVIIDPGHGGYDPGVKKADVYEKNITLTMSKQLQQALSSKGIYTILTRDTDTDYATQGQRGGSAKRTDLDKRIAIAKFNHARVFVSLHVNQSSLATRGGAEVFYNHIDGAKELGESIQTRLHDLPQMSKRSAKPETYYLLENLDIPACIVEMGYLNLSPDQELLQNPAYQKTLANALAMGINDFLESQAKK